MSLPEITAAESETAKVRAPREPLHLQALEAVSFSTIFKVYKVSNPASRTVN